MNVYKIKLTKRTGDSLYLTPNSYLYIEETDDKCSIINFTDKHWVTVQESPEEIFNIIKNSERIL